MICAYVREVILKDAPYSIHSSYELKRVLPTPPFFSRGDVLEGWYWWKLRASVDVADGQNPLYVAGLRVEKKDGKDTTTHVRRNNFLEYGLEKVFVFVIVL